MTCKLNTIGLALCTHGRISWTNTAVKRSKGTKDFEMTCEKNKACWRNRVGDCKKSIEKYLKSVSNFNLFIRLAWISRFSSWWKCFLKIASYGNRKFGLKLAAQTRTRYILDSTCFMFQFRSALLKYMVSRPNTFIKNDQSTSYFMPLH